ncbi:MAG: hypothetical protein JST35_08355 [Armatimonadetes bacterium]|nr:hypothetical protein [Armatimonadota bacterium]
MDAFEQIVKVVLEGEGWWVRQGYKVELTKDEKVAIGRHSSPRWEIDLVAYKPSTNQILAVECKSFLDSRGVTASEFFESDTATKARYKLFNEAKLREVVLRRLKFQMAAEGLALPDSQVRLAMAVGKFKSPSDREALRKKFDERGWQLIDDDQMRRWALKLSERGYEDSVATIVAKLIAPEVAKITRAGQARTMN